MEVHISTSPFGRRPLMLAHVATQAEARARPTDKAVHKWQVFRADVVDRLVALTPSEPPGETTHWTSPAMAQATGISVSSVQRIWKAHGLGRVDGVSCVISRHTLNTRGVGNIRVSH